ncbi:MAG: hypothetical protein HQ538_01065, partial [Parcubacteria group bacterium]|nr:hypothetical protein [Parcubacteria group bacterium]
MHTLKRILISSIIFSISFGSFLPALTAKASTNQRSVVEKAGDVIDKSKIEDKTEKKDWSAVDWDQEILMLLDYDKYQKEMEELKTKGDSKEMAKLKPRKRKMSDSEVMKYYGVPENIKSIVEEYSRSVLKLKKDSDERKTAKNRLKEDILSLDKKLVEILKDNKKIINNIKERRLPENFIDLNKIKRTNYSGIQPVARKIDNKINYKIVSENKNKKSLQPKNLEQITPRGIYEKFKDKKELDFINQSIEIKNKLEKKKTGLIEGLKNLLSRLFKVDVARAATSFINYYEGIENNNLDYALYYLSNQQNSDGSFGEFNQYENTTEVIMAMNSFNRTDSDQYNLAINYVKNTQPKNNREKAIKARLMFGLGQPYKQFLTEIFADKNSDGGYGLHEDYPSDILTTLEVALAMAAANTSTQTNLPKALTYALINIPTDGKLKFNDESDPNYFLINRTLKYLFPFQTLSVSNGQIQITVQSRIDALLTYLKSQFDEEEVNLLNAQDIGDEIMTVLSWDLYDQEKINLKNLKEKLKDAQSSDGSFGNNSFMTIQGMSGMSQADIEIVAFSAQSTLENWAAASFQISFYNKGYASAASTTVYLFADYIKLGADLDLSSLSLPPNTTTTINFNLVDTRHLIGTTTLKLYAEPKNDSKYIDNWIERTFYFSPSSSGDAAFSLYNILTPSDILSGSTLIPSIAAGWHVKNDPNRKDYYLLYRKDGIGSWTASQIPSSLYVGKTYVGGAFSPFDEGAMYETVIGVMNQSNLIHYDPLQIAVVHTGIDSSLNKTSDISGYLTNDNQKDIDINLHTRSTTTFANNNFYVTGLRDGNSCSFITSPASIAYEKLYTCYKRTYNATTTDIRVFTTLKEDNTKPTITDFKIWNITNTTTLNNQQEIDLLTVTNDNIRIKEVDFYYYSPSTTNWIYISTQNSNYSSQPVYKWYIPKALVGKNFKLKAIARDFRGNESVAKELGPFEILNGSIPVINITKPTSGDVFTLGSSTIDIIWNTQAAYQISKVNIDMIFATNSMGNIVYDLNNTGSYQFSPPVYWSSGNNVKIRISGTDDVNGKTVTVYSKPFSLVSPPPPPTPFVQVISPNGGEAFKLGASTTIKWYATSTNPINSVRIKASYPGSKPYIKSGAPNTGSYVWTIPNSSDYLGDKIKIEIIAEDSKTGALGSDESDNYFSINTNSTVDLPWNQPKVLTDAGVYTNTTTGSGGIKDYATAYDNSGNLHLVYRFEYDNYKSPIKLITEKIYHKIRNSNGIWGQEKIISQSTLTTDSSLTGYKYKNGLKIKVDSSDTIHLLWRESGVTQSGGCTNFNTNEIYYANYDGTTFSTPQNITNNNTESYQQDFAVKGNEVHVVWLDGKTWDSSCKGTGTRKVNYATRLSGSWGAISQLNTDEYPTYPQIQATQDGKIHLLYKGGSVNQLSHIYKQGSTWSASTTIADMSDGYNLELAAGQNTSTLHYVFKQYYSDFINGSGARVIYGYYDSNKWSSSDVAVPLIKGYHAEDPKISVDNSDNPHIVFEHYYSPTSKRKLGWITGNKKGVWINQKYISLDSQYADDLSVNTYNNTISAFWLSGYAYYGNIHYNYTTNADINLFKKPVLKYDFNEPSGATTFTDSSGYNNNASCSGAYCPQAGVIGASSTAIQFDGINDYMQVADSESLNLTDTVTLEAWIKPDLNNTDSPWQTIVTKQLNYELNISRDGRVMGGIYNEDNKRVFALTPKPVLIKDKWSHVAMTYDGSKIRVYVDGVEKAVRNQTGKIRVLKNPVSIGKIHIFNYYHGLMDELKVRNRVLSASEINTIYKQSISDLRLHLKFDTPITSKFIDYSNNGNQGTFFISA